MALPPAAPMMLLGTTRSLSWGAWPLRSLPRARPVPSPSLLCERSGEREGGGKREAELISFNIECITVCKTRSRPHLRTVRPHPHLHAVRPHPHLHAVRRPCSHNHSLYT